MAAEAMRANVASLLKGIDRYNPENLATLERYVDLQARENAYDLEANLAVLKLYQFNPNFYQTEVTSIILLKALTNLPHTDYVLCKCLIDLARFEEEPLTTINGIAEFLETCRFHEIWEIVSQQSALIGTIVGFEDSIRKYICHVVGATYQTIDFKVLKALLGNIADSTVTQWISKYGWSMKEEGVVFIVNQEELIKTKNITEKISFDSVAAIMAGAR